jgi:Pyruvate/2-oxoacid:ferredoxin oxidoreductase delta subunit
MQNIYDRLAKHLHGLIMGYPVNTALIDLLQAMYSPIEAEVALAIPNTLDPLDAVSLDEIVSAAALPRATVSEALQSMAQRNMVFTTKCEDGSTGYALLQVGYGVPQTFFWGGQNDANAKRMARLVLKYFNVPTTREVYGGVPTKTYKYSPANMNIDIALQGVLPFEKMDTIVDQAEKIAVAHCPCRISARILGRTDCAHSLEVCIKYDEMADFVVSRGLARAISKDEARHILKESEKEGLVHMVDNAKGQIKHTCNCCGHYCWNVGIIRRRKIPRDQLMAVYFMRETEISECIGCGTCAEICPVAAVQMSDDVPQVDTDWCIGCGVCAVHCPASVISIVRRIPDTSPSSFHDLHQQIRTEKKGR